MAFHPPAAGGKTAWGVGDLISYTIQDTEELQKRRKGAAEFNDREQTRLNNLHSMQRNAEDIQASRRERTRQWEMGLIGKGADDFKDKQLEILRKLEENKNARKQEKREKRKAEALAKDGDKKKKKSDKDPKGSKKKKKKESSSSSSSSSSASSSSSKSSSSSSAKKDKKNKKSKTVVEKGGIIPLQKPPELDPAQKAAALEAKRRAEEAKAKDREIKRQAKEKLKAFEEEAKRKAAGEEARQEADARRKAAEAQAKKQEDAKSKKEQEDAKKKEEEEKKAAEAEARRKACQEAASKVKSSGMDVKKDVREKVAGGFHKGQHVVATKDITIRGALIVRNGTAGTIMGKADTDPVNRIAVRFVPRADGQNAPINCVPIELRKG